MPLYRAVTKMLDKQMLGEALEEQNLKAGRESKKFKAHWHKSIMLLILMDPLSLH